MYPLLLTITYCYVGNYATCNIDNYCAFVHICNVFNVKEQIFTGLRYRL
jgi:hypothetical protein